MVATATERNYTLMATLHCTTEIGKIKPMHAVNNGPGGSAVRGTGNDEAFCAAGIPYARNHDASFYSGYGGEDTVDVHRIFRDFSRNEYDPASYDFRATDAYVARTEACGTHVFYRLGASIEHGIKHGTFPPSDFAKWARICAHIIRHYNEGWANGFHYGITYWEIWNEPDCVNPDGSNPCWQGTEEEFVTFFCTALSYLKTTFPTLKIGGPAFCGGPSFDSAVPSLHHKLFSALQAQGLRPDFYSFHFYGRTPEDACYVISLHDRLLAQYGMTGVETILNEWNYNCGWIGEDFTRGVETIKGQKGASFTTAVMCAGQASTLSMLMYYDARPSSYCGLFDTDTLQRRPGYYPFYFYGNLYRMGTALPLTDLPAGIYGCAATDGERYGVLLTRYQDGGVPGKEEAPFALQLELPGGETCHVTQYRLDGACPPRSETLTPDENGALTLSCPMYTVLYLEIEKA